MTPPREGTRGLRHALIVAGLLGLYLSTQGYRSLEGDQAFRLPLVLDRQDPSLYAADPFVRAFDAFNPHRGYLALLDGMSRLVGMPLTLASLFAAVFALTAVGFERLGRLLAPGVPGAGWAVACLVFITRAGNIGTNHLFEPTLLDRLIALGLFWNALGVIVATPSAAWRAALWLLPAAVVHPSLGLQLGLALAAVRVFWWLRGMDGLGGGKRAARDAGLLLLAVAPGVAQVAAQGDVLFAGLPREEFRRIAGYLQSPQHMIPSLWRAPQWVAWLCFPVLALRFWKVGIWRNESRRRLAALLVLLLVGLAVSAFLIEVPRNARITLMQPFRMATVVRGLCLILIAPVLLEYWRSGDPTRQARAVLLASGLVGDAAFVVGTLVEFAAALGERRSSRWGAWAGAGMLGLGLWYLYRHDPEQGERPLILGLLGLAFVRLLIANVWREPPAWTLSRQFRLVAYAWVVPLLAFAWPLGWESQPEWLEQVGSKLAAHCRFREYPRDDAERLALWCREHVPREARFVAAPGAKSFRLWSRRSLAFNRAGCPYHAKAVADWLARYRDHVQFEGSDPAFVSAYLENRHRLEAGYDALNAEELAGLAARQGAGYVVARAGLSGGGLEPIHTEGDEAVYRVRSAAVLARGDAPATR